MWFFITLPVVLVASVRAAVTTGNFSLLTYNVAGLPELLSSGDPAVNTPLISPRLRPYGVINVQEDFNYHAALYAGDDHTYRTPTSGGVPFGSGLNTLSNHQYTELERVTWSRCDLNDGDCLTPKGFSLTRIRVSDGAWIDVYNLHADAGSDSGDRTARASNFAQLTAFIASWSAGMPIVVMGDTNSRYTSAVDSTSLRTFISATGVTDAWISRIRGGSYPVENTTALTCLFPFASGTSQAAMNGCEVVDKIFVRSSPAVALTATSFANAHTAFVNASGFPLSDHYPITASISWTLSSSIRLSEQHGGPHGTPFSNIPTIISAGAVPKLTSVTIRGGERIDQVGLTATYTNGTTRSTSHGGTGGTATTWTMSSGEHIIRVTTCQGQKDGNTRVFSLAFFTNLSRALSAGSTTSDCLTMSVPTDAGAGAWGLVGFWGRAGDEVDRLGVIWGAIY